MATDSGNTYACAANKYALYGEGSINTSLNCYAIKGQLGFRGRRQAAA